MNNICLLVYSGNNGPMWRYYCLDNEEDLRRLLQSNGVLLKIYASAIPSLFFDFKKDIYWNDLSELEKNQLLDLARIDFDEQLSRAIEREKKASPDILKREAVFCPYKFLSINKEMKIFFTMHSGLSDLD